MTQSAQGFYNDPEVMDRYLQAYQPDDRPALEHWLKRSPASGPILEIGSGAGVLQGVGEPYVALDFSQVALQKWIDPRHARVGASAERLPFADCRFRLVYSVACLEHVPEAARAFEEIHRVLQPGGIAYLAPAWHCVQYNCDGVPVRPYRDLSAGNKLVKATLPLRRLPLIKALSLI